MKHHLYASCVIPSGVPSTRDGIKGSLHSFSRNDGYEWENYEENKCNNSGDPESVNRLIRSTNFAGSSIWGKEKVPNLCVYYGHTEAYSIVIV